MSAIKKSKSLNDIRRSTKTYYVFLQLNGFLQLLKYTFFSLVLMDPRDHYRFKTLIIIEFPNSL